MGLRLERDTNCDEEWRIWSYDRLWITKKASELPQLVFGMQSALVSALTPHLAVLLRSPLLWLLGELLFQHWLEHWKGLSELYVLHLCMLYVSFASGIVEIILVKFICHAMHSNAFGWHPMPVIVILCRRSSSLMYGSWALISISISPTLFHSQRSFHTFL